MSLCNDDPRRSWPRIRYGNGRGIRSFIPLEFSVFVCYIPSPMASYHPSVRVGNSLKQVGTITSRDHDAFPNDAVGWKATGPRGAVPCAPESGVYSLSRLTTLYVVGVIDARLAPTLIARLGLCVSILDRVRA